MISDKALTLIEVFLRWTCFIGLAFSVILLIIVIVVKGLSVELIPAMFYLACAASIMFYALSLDIGD